MGNFFIAFITVTSIYLFYYIGIILYDLMKSARAEEDEEDLLTPSDEPSAATLVTEKPDGSYQLEQEGISELEQSIIPGMKAAYSPEKDSEQEEIPVSPSSELEEERKRQSEEEEEASLEEEQERDKLNEALRVQEEHMQYIPVTPQQELSDDDFFLALLEPLSESSHISRTLITL